MIAARRSGGRWRSAVGSPTEPARLAKALGHRHRLAILTLLAKDESSVAAVARRTGLSVANASHHLRSMRDAGLLAARRDGKRVFYRLHDPSAVELAAILAGAEGRRTHATDDVAGGHDAGPARANIAPPSRMPSAIPTTTSDPLDWLAAIGIARPRQLAAGEVLFRQAEVAGAIYQVAEGRMRLMRHTADHRSVTLHTARRGELFAEASLFSATYHCDAVAALPSRVWVYPKPRLLAAFQDDPALALRLTATLARQVQSLRARLEGRNIRSAQERVLHHLSLAAGGGRSLFLDGTLIDLAQEIGLSHEALYRTLAALERDGVITRRGREIVVGGREAV